MKEKNLIIICLAAVLCIGAISVTGLLSNQNSNNNTENDTINITLNDSQNNTTENTTTTKKTTTTTKSSGKEADEESEYGDYIDDEWVSMSEEEYANRYPALYHEQSLSEGKYDKYHPEFYEVDRENGRI